VQVPSDKDAGTVLAQDPHPGESVVEGTKVRINVSKGPQPVGVPSVVSLSFEDASSQLQAAGFAVAKVDVSSNQPAGTVVDQNPAAGSFVAKGSTVTLKVAKGPVTTAVPDVTSQDQDSATQNLKASGFNVAVQKQDTQDPNSDGVVLSQDPEGGTQAKKGATVTITVGNFTG
jgi:serine/threonine-protein kinase